MFVKHDYKYIGQSEQELVNMGLAEITVHSLNFDRFYSEEEKEENKKQADILRLGSAEWNERCDKRSFETYNKLLPIIEQLDKVYDIHQYQSEKSSIDHYRTNWDLFYYSNRGWNGKDYFDRFELSFNDNRTVEENQKLFEDLLNFIENHDDKNLSCRIQYQVRKDKAKIKELASSIFESLQNKFINVNGMTGKARIVEGVYAFFKKGAKKRYYPLSPESIIFASVCE